MYASSEIPILDSDNNSSLFEKLAIIGKNLLMENIEDIYNGKMRELCKMKKKLLFLLILHPRKKN